MCVGAWMPGLRRSSPICQQIDRADARDSPASRSLRPHYSQAVRRFELLWSAVWTNDPVRGRLPRLADPARCASDFPHVFHRSVQPDPSGVKLHLHLLSDSTGETLENIAKAALAQFDDVEVLRHFWPMVRSETHLERILIEIGQNPGLVIFTLVNPEIRRQLETRCRAMGLPAVAPLDPVNHALSNLLGQEMKARPGRQHMLDAAYFARVDAIQFTIAHDDGVNWENWEEADIVLAGVSRTSKTPTSIYLANRGYKAANIPIVPQSPPPDASNKSRKGPR